MIAALFVETGGVYYGLDNVDPWDRERDARNYNGPWPVVAHPPCERWGRFWHGSTRKPHQYKLGDDGGCFKAALAAVIRWGGVLEHPADSHAWKAFDLPRPAKGGGWACDWLRGLFACHVEQGFYGHFSRKPTWLLARATELPELRWGRGEQRLHPVALAKHGYEKARRIGMVAMVGGKHKKAIRDRTPHEFRDLLISIAHSATTPSVAAPASASPRSDAVPAGQFPSGQPAPISTETGDIRRAEISVTAELERLRASSRPTRTCLPKLADRALQ